MKKLSTRSVAVALAALLALPATLVALASLPEPPRRAAASPRLETIVRGEGPLSAGAAEVPYALPAATPIAGFARLTYESAPARDATGARALVVSSGGRRIALVSADLLLVPAPLEAAVRARLHGLPLDGLVIGATHTHAGPGGFWEDLVGERLGTGPYDPAVRDAIARAIAEAVRRAAGAEVPARLAVARGQAEELARNRSGGARDGRLTVLRVSRVAGGGPIGELALFAAHPTTLGKRNRALSGDWPSRFSAGGSHGVRLLFQGAGGDQSVALPTPGPVTPDRFAAALSTVVDELRFGEPELAPALGFASAAVTLPPPSPGAVPSLLERASRNFAWDRLPGRATVAAVQLGPVRLVAVPAEPTAAVGARLREVAGPGAEILSLAGGYVGYVEVPSRMAERAGETVRTYYGPELAGRLEEAVGTVASALEERVGSATAPRPGSASAP